MQSVWKIKVNKNKFKFPNKFERSETRIKGILSDKANKVSYLGKQKGQEVVICNRIFCHNLYDSKRQEQMQRFQFDFRHLLMYTSFSKNLEVLL